MQEILDIESVYIELIKWYEYDHNVLKFTKSFYGVHKYLLTI